MGIFQQKPKKVGITAKITDLEKKVAQLRAGGLDLAADRIEQQIKQYKPNKEEKVKALSPRELRRQVEGARATGQAK